MACKEEPKGPKPPLPGLVMLKINWTGPGVPTPIAANILHGRWLDNANHSIADLNSLLANFNTGVTTRLLQVVNTAWTCSSLIVQSLGGDGNLTTQAVGSPGVGSGNCLQPQVAACGSWTSTASWRGGKPRTYLPGVSASYITTVGGAALTPTASTNYKTQFTAFLAQVNATTGGGAAFNMGFPSYYSKCAFRPTPLFFPFLGVVVHDRVDSQRRRSGKERYFAIT